MALNTPGKPVAALPFPALKPLGHHSGKPPIPLGRPVTLVGSRHNAHLHLLSRQISKAHAVLINSNNKVYIRDLASRTHVYVNGVEVRETDLNDGDLVQIGSFTFRFMAPAPTSRPLRARRAPAGSLELGGGLGDDVELRDRVLLVGRRQNCDLPLLEAEVSTAHAIIFEMNGRRYVRDLGSRTGTFVNDQPVKQVELRPGDSLQIGGTLLHYSAASSTPEPVKSQPAVAPPPRPATTRVTAHESNLLPLDLIDEPSVAPPPTGLPAPSAPPGPFATGTSKAASPGDTVSFAAVGGDVVDLASDPDVAGGHDTAALPAAEPARPTGISDRIVDGTGDEDTEQQLLVDGDIFAERLSSSATFADLQGPAEEAQRAAGEHPSHIPSAAEPTSPFEPPHPSESLLAQPPQPEEHLEELLHLDGEAPAAALKAVDPVQPSAPLPPQAPAAESEAAMEVDASPPAVEEEPVKAPEPAPAPPPTPVPAPPIEITPAPPVPVQPPPLISGGDVALKFAPADPPQEQESAPPAPVQLGELKLEFEPGTTDESDAADALAALQPLGDLADEPPADAGTAGLMFGAGTASAIEPELKFTDPAAEPDKATAESPRRKSRRGGRRKQPDAVSADPAVSATPTPAPIVPDSVEPAPAEPTSVEPAPPLPVPQAPEMAQPALSQPSPETPPVEPERIEAASPAEKLQLPVVEVIEETQPTVDSAQSLAEAVEPVAPVAAETSSAADLTDTTFGRMVEEFAEPSLGDLVELAPQSQPAPAEPETPAEPEAPADAPIEADLNFADDFNIEVEPELDEEVDLSGDAPPAFESLQLDIAADPSPLLAEPAQEPEPQPQAVQLPPAPQEQAPPIPPQTQPSPEPEDGKPRGISMAGAAVFEQVMTTDAAFVAELPPLEPAVAPALDAEEPGAPLGMEAPGESVIVLPPLDSPVDAPPGLQEEPPTAAEEPEAQPPAATEEPASGPASADANSFEVGTEQAWFFGGLPLALEPPRSPFADKPVDFDTRPQVREADVFAESPADLPAAEAILNASGGDDDELDAAGDLLAEEPIAEVATTEAEIVELAPSQVESALETEESTEATADVEPEVVPPPRPTRARRVLEPEEQEDPSLDEEGGNGHAEPSQPARRQRAPLKLPVPPRPDQLGHGERSGQLAPVPMRRAQRRLRLLPMLVVMVLAAAAALAAIWWLVPPRVTVSAALRYNNYGNLSILGQQEFSKKQEMLLREPLVRETAISLLGDGVSPGFLGSAISLGYMAIDFPSNSRENSQVGTLSLRHNGRDPADRQRVFAVLQAIYQHPDNQDLIHGANRFEQQLRDASNSLIQTETALKLKMQQLESLKEVGERAPDPQELAALDNEVNALQKTCERVKAARVDLEREVEQLKAPSTQPQQAPTADGVDEARKKLDESVASFQDTLGRAQDLVKDNPDLAAYMAAAQRLQEAARKLSGDLIQRQQTQQDTLVNLKRRLDEALQARRQELWSGDEELKKLTLDLGMKTREYSAATSSDMPEAKERAAALKAEVDNLNEQIKGRKLLLGNDSLYTDALTELKQIIEGNQKQLELDRRDTDQMMQELEAAVSLTAPSIEKLPRNQQELADLLKKRMEAMKEARRAYSELAQQQASAAVAAKPTAEQRAALLVTKKQELDHAMQLEQEASTQYDQKRREAESKRLLLATAQKNRTTEDKLRVEQSDLDKELHRLVQEKKNVAAALERSVTPLPPAIESVTMETHDPRSWYMLYALGGIVVVCAGLMLFTSLGHAPAAPIAVQPIPDDAEPQDGEEPLAADEEPEALESGNGNQFRR